MTDDQAFEMNRATDTSGAKTYYCGKDIQEMNAQELRLALIHMAKLHSDAIERNRRNLLAFGRDTYSGSYGGHGFS